MATIDASNLVLGRMASSVAKRVLRGESIDIINGEKSVIIGRREDILEKFKIWRSMQAKGNPETSGPKYPRMPDRIVKRTIRGMLPHRCTRGMMALKRVKVWIGVPKDIDVSNIEILEKAKAKDNVSKMSIEEVSRNLGARW